MDSEIASKHDVEEKCYFKDIRPEPKLLGNASFHSCISMI